MHAARSHIHTNQSEKKKLEIFYHEFSEKCEKQRQHTSITILLYINYISLFATRYRLSKLIATLSNNIYIWIYKHTPYIYEYPLPYRIIKHPSGFFSPHCSMNQYIRLVVAGLLFYAFSLFACTPALCLLACLLARTCIVYICLSVDVAYSYSWVHKLGSVPILAVYKWNWNERIHQWKTLEPPNRTLFEFDCFSLVWAFHQFCCFFVTHSIPHLNFECMCMCVVIFGCLYFLL